MVKIARDFSDQTNVKAMTQTTLSAAGLIELRSAQQRGDERVRPIIVHDLALADWPERSMMFDPNRVNPTVIVRTAGYTPFFIERIELLQPDADQRLGRYRLVEASSRPLKNIAVGG